ncbi:MAG: SxtJ family membrane protein [candidate division KSB1 bacterium]|nr:SxtJ family membrane protein [candidate division KSB1 bacterium]
MSWIKDIYADYLRLDKSSAKAASFGYLFAVILSLLGIAILIAGKVPQRSLYFFASAFLFTLFARFFPSLLKPLFSAWMILSLLLGWIMSRLLLTIVFFIVITPISFLMSLLGKDPLNRRFDKNAPTYWSTKPNDPHRDFQKQF